MTEVVIPAEILEVPAVRDDRITPTAEYGVHIPLTCKNHPELRWHTKNIGGIGSRRIFFSGGYVNGEFKHGADGSLAYDLKLIERGTLNIKGDDGEWRTAVTADIPVLEAYWAKVAKEFAIECACPMRDLQVVEAE